MKKILTFFAVLSFITMNAQFEKGTIYLKDGNTQDGLIKIRTLGGIKYKKNEDSEIKLYDYNDLSGYDIKEKGIQKFRYKKVGNNFPQSMRIVRLGKINLYSIKIAKREIVTGIRTHYSFIYFIEKDNVTIRVGIKLSKNELQLFKDCPSLFKKIKKKEFKKSDVYQIVNFYDINCS